MRVRVALALGVAEHVGRAAPALHWSNKEQSNRTKHQPPSLHRRRAGGEREEGEGGDVIMAANKKRVQKNSLISPPRKAAYLEASPARGGGGGGFKSPPLSKSASRGSLNMTENPLSISRNGSRSSSVSSSRRN